MRQPDEALRSFLLRLQKQAAKCEFGTELQTQLRDRVVAGINNTEIQRKLLTRPHLTFTEAKHILETWDDINMALSSQGSASSQVLYHERATPKKKNFKPHSSKWCGRDNSGRKPTSATSKPSGTCDSCGGQHLRSKCKFRDAECRKCHKRGHIQRVCRSSPSNEAAAITLHPEDSDEDYKA